MSAVGFTPIQLYRSTTASAVPTSGNLADGELAINTNDGKLYYKDSGGAVQLIASKAGASGDVVGPASATDNAVVRFDGTTGKLVQNSVVTIADSTGDVAGVGALTMGGNLTLNGGTANGVLYLNGSKVATSGSALTFDGSTFSVAGEVRANATFRSSDGTNIGIFGSNVLASGVIGVTSSNNIPLAFGVAATEQMRLTSTGLGIGTSSPSQKLTVVGNALVTPTGGWTTSGVATQYFGDVYGSIKYDYNTTNFLISSYGSFSIATNGISPTTRLTVDSSGNLGLGVTPSAWDSASKAFQISSHAVFAAYTSGTNQQALLLNNAYLSATGYKYLNSNYATYYQQQASAGTHAWFTAPSGTAGNAISFTQALTLNTNGALVLQGGDTAASGVGVTFPATQSASSNANTLDDYEEGTWTATLTDGTSTAVSGGATYRKIGSLVFVDLQVYAVNISGWTTSGLSITGLPFPVSSNHDAFVTANIPNTSTASAPFVGGFINGTSSISLFARGGGSNYSAVQKNDFSNNSAFSVYLSGCYTSA